MLINDLYDSKNYFITPNESLCHQLKQQYHEQQRLTKKTSFEDLPASSIKQFLIHCWYLVAANDVSHPTLLNSQQSQWVWKHRIETTPIPQTNPIDTSSWVHRCQETWQITQQWDLDQTSCAQSTQDSEAAYAFKQWAKQYQQFCRTKHCLDIHQIPKYLLGAIDLLASQLPQNLTLIGFYEIWPRLQTLFSALNAAGINLIKQNNGSDSFPTIGKTDSPELYPNTAIAFDSQEEEVTAAARWAKLQIMQQNTPIACIVPDVKSWQPMVETLFTEIFAPSYPIAISARKTLNSFPLIDTALQILQLPLQAQWPISTLSDLLCSPFLGKAHSHRTKRLQQDLQIRALGVHQYPWAQLDLPGLATLSNLVPHTLKSPSTWYAFFAHLLNQMGWPGERPLSEQAYQLFTRWASLLETFTTLDSLMPTCDYKTAVQTLLHRATHTTLCLKTPHRPISLLTLPEAAPLDFKAVWVLGMQQNDYPLSEKNYIMLSKEVQKKHILHTNKDIMLDFSKQLLNHITQSSKNVILSYAKWIDHCPQFPSTLIKHSLASEQSDWVAELLSDSKLSPISEKLYQSNLLTFIKDVSSYPVHPTQPHKALNTALLNHQSACPFKAFAKGRLYAEALPRTVFGLSPSLRGQWLHEILADIWRQLGHQKQLKATADETLSKIIQQSVAHTKKKLPKPVIDAMPRWLIRFESEFLSNMVQAWLTIEKQRPPFQVLGQEAVFNTTLNKLPLQLRIDRIDVLEDGTKVIIDYKSGAPFSLNSWFKSRLEHVQLPLYCSTYPDSIGGIAIAYIRLEPLTFQGIVDTSHSFSDLKTPQQIRYTNEFKNTWQDLKSRWHQQLIQLAKDFESGQAQVDPIDANITCSYCDLQSLCRIHSMGRLQTAI